MTGFAIGVLAAFFWSITNIIDKYLVTKYSQNGNVGSILLLSCFFPIILILLSALVAGTLVFQLSLLSIIYLILSGVLMVAWIYLYLKALNEGETSVVMTLLVLAPIFSFIFGFFLLHELPTAIQGIACGFLVVGALVICYEQEYGSLNWKLLAYALGATAITGFMHSLFKLVTLEGTIWQSLFWRSAGMVLSGLLLAFFIKKYRLAFMDFIKKYFAHGAGLHTTNESLTLLGDTLFAIAILFTPLVIVQTSEAYQPLFVFIIVFVLSRFGFSGVKESHSFFSAAQKLVSFCLVLTGTLLLMIHS